MDVREDIRDSEPNWFAIKTRNEFRAEKELASECDSVLLPKEVVREAGKKERVKPLIPHVLFIMTTQKKALELEKLSREHPEQIVKFWIYRYPNNNQIQVIPPESIHLLRLLSNDDPNKCQIFNKVEFKEQQRVRIIGGCFDGYSGYVVRVRKNRHVVVKIEGICLVMLPYIHPDLLEPMN